jgi:hypothetical protein
MILQMRSVSAAAPMSEGAVCADCGASASGNFCSSCGADLRQSSLGFLGQAAAPVRRSYPIVFLKLLRAPVRQTVAIAEDPSYRGHVSFMLTSIAIYVLLFVPVIMQAVIPTGGNVHVSESMQTLMKILSQVGIYVGMAITFALAYAIFRYFATVKRPFHAYFKLYCLALGFMAPIYGAYEFIVRLMVGGIGMSTFGAPMTGADWLSPSAIASVVLSLLLWAYFVAIHRRFWAMPVWKATALYLVASVVSYQVGYQLMWQVGFYSAKMLTAAGIVTI